MPQCKAVLAVTRTPVHPATVAFMPKACRINYSVNIMGRAELFRTKPKLSAEVLMRVATSLEFCPPQHHMANNDFVYSAEVLDLR
jgi:hypothetical protein